VGEKETKAGFLALGTELLRGTIYWDREDHGRIRFGKQKMKNFIWTSSSTGENRRLER
jgi:hypothetical protein